jgi:hypothetical protein
MPTIRGDIKNKIETGKLSREGKFKIDRFFVVQVCMSHQCLVNLYCVRGWQLVHFDQEKFNQSISTLDDISEFFLAWNVDYVTMVHIKWAFHYSLENYSGGTEKQLNLPLSHGQTHHAPNADSGTEGAVLILVALRRVVFAELQPWIQ